MHSLNDFIINAGYVAVFLLAMAESACIPIPSELTFGLAGALCSSAAVKLGMDPGTHLSLLVVILLGVLGSVAGSLLAYVVGRTAGRSIVDRFGRWILLTHEDLDKAEAWFEGRGHWSVLVGRVIPVVRTFISFPAGVAEMNLRTFTWMTTIGVTVWVGVLSIIGYEVGGQYEKYMKGFSWAGYLVVAVVVVLGAIALRHRIQQVKRANGAGPKHAKQ